MRGKKLNGWRRLWLVLTGLALIGGVLFAANFALNYGEDWKYNSAARKDFQSANCAKFQNDPFPSLQEPTYDSEGGGCWHLYTSRFFDAKAHGDIFPYTENVYYANKLLEKWQQFGLGLLIYSVGIALCAAIIYALGAMVAWIVRGFART